MVQGDREAFRWRRSLGEHKVTLEAARRAVAGSLSALRRFNDLFEDSLVAIELFDSGVLDEVLRKQPLGMASRAQPG
jgi:hypothetical protein